MWQVYLDFRKRRGCSYSDRIYVPRLAINAESLDGNKLESGWIKEEKFSYLIMLVLENKGKARVRAEVCSGKVKIDAPRLSEICNVDTVDIRWGIVELPIWK